MCVYIYIYKNIFFLRFLKVEYKLITDIMEFLFHTSLEEGSYELFHQLNNIKNKGNSHLSHANLSLTPLVAKWLQFQISHRHTDMHSVYKKTISSYFVRKENLTEAHLQTFAQFSYGQDWYTYAKMQRKLGEQASHI